MAENSINRGGRPTIDITSKIFDRWRVFVRLGSNSRKAPLWLCVCECGTFRRVMGYTLLNGTSRSCGCLTAEVKRKERTTHSLSAATEYNTFRLMHSRCSNPKDKDHKRYGARGISVCPKWSDLLTFIEDVGPKPGPEYTLDRIDTMGNYEPGNVRWATGKEQARNRRRNHLITIGGETKTMIEWAEYFNFPYDLFRSRISYGWSVEKIISTPRRVTRRTRCLN